MAVPTFMQGVQMSFLDTANARHKAQLAAAKADPKTQVAAVADPDSKSDDSGFTFDDALDIINPLQHLPVVSTVYRALTGDKIKPLERVAGDTLYGGIPGFMSSVANLAFEKFTGKDFGDTAMAWLGLDDLGSQTQIAAVDITPEKTLGDDKTAVIADNTRSAPSQPVTAQPVVAQNVMVAAQAPVPGAPLPAITLDAQSIAALTQSMQKNGIDSDLGLRAVSAYQKMLSDPKTATQPPAALH